MQVFNSPAEFQQVHRNCAATIGKYDGMHLGHQKILQNLKAEAEALDLPSVVILSEPHPEEFFAGDQAPPRLNQFVDKVEFLQAFGIDAVYRLNFDESLSRYTPGEFVQDILLEGLGIKSLIIGDDFRFGHEREGDFALLEILGNNHGFRVTSVPECLFDGERVSSTLVREYLQRDDLDKVRSLLGRPYSMSGEVSRGLQLGRQLGAPTANIRLPCERLPITGIYAVNVMIEGELHSGVASIGFRPSVTSAGEPLLEVYLFDFDADIYGVWIKIMFLQKIRSEEKFDTLEELKNQIAMDVSDARSYFASAVTT